MVLFISFTQTSCKGVKEKSNSKIESETNDKSITMDFIEEKTIVYRTSKATDNNVPVIVDEDFQITSYPAPSDVIIDGQLKKPIVLGNNWYIDQIGISRNSAFTGITFEEYSKLNQVNLTEIEKGILQDIAVYDICKCDASVSYEDIKQAFSNGEHNQFIGANCKRIYTKRVPKKN